MTIGNKHWAIPEGLISPLGDEAIAFLNASSQEPHVQIFVYYSNRDPVGPYRLTVPAGRLRRVRFSGLKDPEPIQRATDYASTIESDVPIVVHPGLASLQPYLVSQENRNL
ncbi:MAG: sensory rhodopsin transducer [Chthoniobacterales bacterium]|nr:MAG: sensory rhodopsin transducer [Chthoniobacterales bacterium]